MARTRDQNLIFFVLLVALVVALWYGTVFVTGTSCSGGTKVFHYTPPPHWTCTYIGYGS